MPNLSSQLLVSLRARFGQHVASNHCEGPVAAFRVPDSGAHPPLQLRFASTEDLEVRALFLAERDIVRTLHQGNVVALLQEGEFEGQAYYAVRCPDPPLRDRLRAQGRLPLTDILRVLRDTTAALAHCHENGVVHGAIDPQHITYGAEGAVLDGFHRAAFIKVFGSPYQDGYVLGTPMYFSPELCNEQPIDGRSDIYSLGMTVYEALVGAPPFLNETDWVRARLEQDPPTPKLKSAKERELYDVLRPMLARDPTARYQSAPAALRALEAVAD